MIIDVLYHWSPSENRVAILRKGLRTYSKASVSTGKYKWPYISASPRPSRAWGLSGQFLKDMAHGHDDPPELWDLWEIRIPKGAEVHVREFWGDEIEEIKIYTSIPPDHLWFVGQRNDLMTAIETS